MHGMLSVEKKKEKTREGGGERIWCLSLERQTRTALNSSNPTPILAHAFGHFPATGSLTEHGEVSGICSPLPLGSGGCVGGELYVDVCTAVCSRRGEGVSVM